jgi:D-sedoheptulose 7-phosphate isomerase
MQKNSDSFTNYASRISKVLTLINPHEVVDLLNCIKKTISRNGTVYVLGNGGSASTASHFVNDLTVIAKRRNVFINAKSLADNIAIITAIANDENYESIFQKQLEGTLCKQDLVFSISVSGNSVNLINAVEYAHECGAETAALTGFNGGKLRIISKYNCLVPTEEGEYGPTEDIHMSICHFLAINIE